MNGRSTEEKVRLIGEDVAAAVRARDLERLMSHYAPDVRFFGLAPPLELVGWDALREQAKAWLASYRDPLDHEVGTLEVAARGEVAFSHGLSHVRGTQIDGTEVDMWWRSTMGYRKIDGRWLIVHRHDSVPLDMTSGRGAVDLTP